MQTILAAREFTRIREHPRSRLSASGLGNLFQCHRVHTVPQATGSGTVGEYVAQMGVAGVADRFNSLQECRSVKTVRNCIFFDRLSEGRPARARFEFLRRIEENSFAAEAGIDSRLEQAAHLGAEGTLRPRLPGDTVLLVV